MRKKYLFIAVLLFACVLVFNGCGGRAEGGEKAAGKAVAEGVTIKFWHMSDTEPGKSMMEKIISDFNEAQKGKIYVNAAAFNFWDYWDKLRVSTAAGEEPEIFFNDLGNVGARADTGILLDLLPYLEADGVDPDEVYFQKPIDMCKFEGGVYSLPYAIDVRLLFYNKDHFQDAGFDPEKPPESWDEMWEIAAKLTKKTPDGFYDSMGVDINVPYSQSFFLMYAWGIDVEAVPDGVPEVNSPEMVRAMEGWMEKIDEYGHDELVAFGGDFGAGAADPFIAGKLSMTVETNAFSSVLAEYGPSIRYGVTQIPYPKRKMSWSNGFTVEISARSEHKDAAYEFVKYLMSDEIQLYTAQESGMLIANKKMSANPELMSDPVWKMSVETLEITKFRPFVLESPVWYEHLQKAIEEVEYGRSGAQEALDMAQGLIDSDFKKYELTH